MVVADGGGDAGAGALGDVPESVRTRRLPRRHVVIIAVVAGHVVGCPRRDLAEVLPKARLACRLQSCKVEPGDRTAKSRLTRCETETLTEYLFGAVQEKWGTPATATIRPALPFPKHLLFGWHVFAEDVKLARAGWALLGDALVLNPKLVLDGHVQQDAKHICDNASRKKKVVRAAKLRIERAVPHRDDQARLGHVHEAAVEHCAEPHVYSGDGNPQGAQAAADAEEDEAQRPAYKGHPWGEVESECGRRWRVMPAA